MLPTVLGARAIDADLGKRNRDVGRMTANRGNRAPLVHDNYQEGLADPFVHEDQPLEAGADFGIVYGRANLCEIMRIGNVLIANIAGDCVHVERLLHKVIPDQA